MRRRGAGLYRASARCRGAIPSERRLADSLARIDRLDCGVVRILCIRILLCVLLGAHWLSSFLPFAFTLNVPERRCCVLAISLRTAPPAAPIQRRWRRRHPQSSAHLAHYLTTQRSIASSITTTVVRSEPEPSRSTSKHTWRSVAASTRRPALSARARLSR